MSESITLPALMNQVLRHPPHIQLFSIASRFAEVFPNDPPGVTPKRIDSSKDILPDNHLEFP